MSCALNSNCGSTGARKQTGRSPPASRACSTRPSRASWTTGSTTLSNAWLSSSSSIRWAPETQAAELGRHALPQRREFSAAKHACCLKVRRLREGGNRKSGQPVSPAASSSSKANHLSKRETATARLSYHDAGSHDILLWGGVNVFASCVFGERQRAVGTPGHRVHATRPQLEFWRGLPAGSTVLS